MNIAILSYEYPPDTGFGGIGTYSWYQSRALAKLGHNVHVVAGATDSSARYSEHDGVKITRIKRGGTLQILESQQQQQRCWWATNRLETAYGAYSTLVHLLDDNRFDIVEMPECGADGALVTTLLQVPTAIKYHSPARLIMENYSTARTDRELASFLEQVAINQVDVHTACSKFLADEVGSKLGVRDPVHVIPNGIDIELFDRDDRIDVHKKFGIPHDGIRVFFANRIEERKGIHIVRDVVWDVMQKHKDVHFVLAGRDLFGYMERRILPFIKANNLEQRFHYVGEIDQASVRAIMKTTDVFFIPSLWENCPYSCLEAMAAGRAIGASDCGGMPELIAHRENGLLATSGNSASFITALDEAIQDAALRERLGGAARQAVENRLTDVAMAQQAVDIYTAALQ